MKIGFVGAGRMGYRMIGNLLHHRHDVCVFDNDEAALRRVAERGASAAASLAEVARQEIVITMLPTPDVSLQVYMATLVYLRSRRAKRCCSNAPLPTS